MHATSGGRLAAMQDVARRLKAQRADLHALITTGGIISASAEPQTRGADWIMPFGSDTTSEARRFIHHWKPDLCLWTGGFFLHSLITVARESGIPMMLLDADAQDIRTSAGNWIPSLEARSLGCFDRILAAGPETAQRLIRKGVPDSKIDVTTPLQISGTPPAVNEDQVDETAEMLAGRFVWLAAHVQIEEVDTVLKAFALAARLSHRLLLVMTPADGVTTEALQRLAEGWSLRCVDWDAGETPDDFCQVIVTEGAPEMGMWYRVAPVTFLGSSLLPGHGGVNPFDAASLGSAVLYGPNVRNHLTSYSRLAAAGAARIVKDANGLSTGVMRLSAPDHAASMALAAWEVVSEGAEATDKLLELVQDKLDKRSSR